jgi:pseudaminic acid cytidylyltransferase
MANLCIIPARGGSKRIPRKNIKDFLGKPIIAYSIETALQSGLFEEVMVSTDDEEIAEVAKRYGAKVPFFRSEENSDDYATTSQVIAEVLEQYSKLGDVFEAACCIYPAAPLIRIERLVEGFVALNAKKAKSTFPVVAYSSPIWRGLKQTSEGRFEMIWPGYLNSRSQDLGKAYHDAGQWYWFNVESFLKEERIYTDNTSCIVLSEYEVQDIDTETDWEMAKIKYQMHHK